MTAAAPEPARDIAWFRRCPTGGTTHLRPSTEDTVTKPAEIVMLESLCGEHGVNFYDLSPEVHVVLNVLVEAAQNYAVFVVKSLGDQLAAQASTVEILDRKGYQLAVNAIKNGQWQHLDGAPDPDPCPYTHAHTRHWCGRSTCRES